MYPNTNLANLLAATSPYPRLSVSTFARGTVELTLFPPKAVTKDETVDEVLRTCRRQGRSIGFFCSFLKGWYVAQICCNMTSNTSSFAANTGRLKHARKNNISFSYYRFLQHMKADLNDFYIYPLV